MNGLYHVSPLLELKIFNIAGELVKRLNIEDFRYSTGERLTSTWLCTNESGKYLASGLYIGDIKFFEKDFRLLQKFAIIK